MSLINNALKKAQRQRSEGAASAPTPGGSTHRPSRRGKAMSAQTLLLTVAGACVVVALSVVATVYFLRTPNPPEPTASVAASKPVAPDATAPVVATPAPVSEAPAPVETEPIVVPQVEAQPEPVPEVIAEPLPEPAPTPTPVSRPDVAIYTYIDQLQVMGVRSSGANSKVLMNDRVYRVNDLVDRTLGLRLTEVTANSLTFVDANGASYIKNF